MDCPDYVLLVSVIPVERKMKKTKLLQEVRMMRFEESYTGYSEKRLTQEEAAMILGVSDRTFRRYMARYEADGVSGLEDKRISRASHRLAPVDEVCRLEDMYREGHQGWNVKHFYSWYKRDGGTRSYNWVRKTLQKSGLVKKGVSRGKHRKRRERRPMAGMMLHQDASTHKWVSGTSWDLVVTMDDATGEHYSMFFVQEEGTVSSFRGVQEAIEKRGLFCSFYSDRGTHYWHTPEAGGKVDKKRLTQFGRAMSQLGIEMIAAYSPEARGRSERVFSTHQGRLPNELALMKIKTMEEANAYLRDHYLPAYNAEFTVQALESGSAFVPVSESQVKEILCEHHKRTVGKDNRVRFDGMVLQIPEQKHRYHYVKSKVTVHRYLDKTLSIYHGHMCLGRYDASGCLLSKEESPCPANENHLKGVI